MSEDSIVAKREDLVKVACLNRLRSAGFETSVINTVKPIKEIEALLKASSYQNVNKFFLNLFSEQGLLGKYRWLTLLQDESSIFTTNDHTDSLVANIMFWRMYHLEKIHSTTATATVVRGINLYTNSIFNPKYTAPYFKFVNEIRNCDMLYIKDFELAHGKEVSCHSVNDVLRYRFSNYKPTFISFAVQPSQEIQQANRDKVGEEILKLYRLISLISANPNISDKDKFSSIAITLNVL